MKKIKLSTLMLVMAALIQMACFSQNIILKAGIAKTDITPTENLYMGGYTGREGPSNGVYGKIFTRALVFDDNISRVVFIENDIVGFPEESYDSLRKLISSETGIPFDNILLGCVHNHSAPYPGDKNKNSAWSKQLNSKIVSTVKSAVANLEPVKLGGGKGTSYVGMNRRKEMEETLTYLCQSDIREI